MLSPGNGHFLWHEFSRVLILLDEVVNERLAYGVRWDRLVAQLLR